jgi:hypothetical protein
MVVVEGESVQVVRLPIKRYLDTFFEVVEDRENSRNL